MPVFLSESGSVSRVTATAGTVAMDTVIRGTVMQRIIPTDTIITRRGITRARSFMLAALAGIGITAGGSIIATTVTGGKRANAI